MSTRRSQGWLGALTVVLGLGLALGGLALVIGVVAAYVGGPSRVLLPTDHVLAVPVPAELRGAATIDPDGEITVLLTDPSAGQATLSVLGWLPSAAVATVMIAMLLGIVRAARSSGPFTAVVARRLRVLGVLVVVGGPLAWLAEFVADFILAGTVSEAGPAASLTLSTPLLWLVAGLGYLAVGEAAHRGLAMQAELDEVI